MTPHAFVLSDREVAARIIGHDNVAQLESLLLLLSQLDAEPACGQNANEIFSKTADAIRDAIKERKLAIAHFVNNGGVLPELTIVEGNIGIGKTTLINKLRENESDWLAVPEPLAIWQNITYRGGATSFERFYQEIGSAEPNRYIFLFEAISLITRFLCLTHWTLHEAQAARAEGRACRQLISERCFLTDRFVFAANLKGKFSPLEFEVYSSLVTSAAEALIFQIPRIIALSSPDTIDLCLERVRGRQRPGEEAISRNYLEQLEYFHIEYFDMLEQKQWGRVYKCTKPPTNKDYFSDLIKN